MAAGKCWIWCPVDKNQASTFKHPADLPIEDEEMAKKLFVEGMRGPKIARISPAQMIKSEGNMALIAEKGSIREVPKYMVLPWYEGLLLLEELQAVDGKSGHLQANWIDQELKGVLDKEKKDRFRRLDGTLYCEKRLMNIAVTGARFVDKEEQEWAFRRENIKAESAVELLDGEDSQQFWRIKEVIGYLPPWEAFHHDKCGFYQDFYQVRWGFPFSEVDYSSVENGCASEKGATWEPDECLPAHLDPLRMAAKRVWIKKKRLEDQKIAAELKAKASGASPSGSASASSKREQAPEPPAPPAKMARVRRDGSGLDRDLLRSRIGHDFAPEAVEASLGKVRHGWPKKPEDYPTGFAVASPPGFCFDRCDCMDDARAQRAWELNKVWLEDSNRVVAANSAVAAFSAQETFVRRRGTVSRRSFFESASGRHLDQTHATAARDLAQGVERAIKDVLQKIPVSSLVRSDSDAVLIPARAFLADDNDYQPISFAGSLTRGTALPQWCQLDPDNGRLVAVRPPGPTDLPMTIQVDLSHAEGHVANALATVIDTRYPPNASPWFSITVPIVLRYADQNRCTLERGVRIALLDHFSEIFDFQRRTAREKSLGAWLQVMTRILCLLRAAAGSNLSLTPAASVARP